jgi:hypothetical protein
MIQCKVLCSRKLRRFKSSSLKARVTKNVMFVTFQLSQRLCAYINFAMLRD